MDLSEIAIDIDNFINQLDQNFSYFKELLIEYEQERDQLFEETHAQREGTAHRRLSTVDRQIAKMFQGDDEFFVLNYLSDHGFLPNYGFSSSNVSLQMYNPAQSKKGDRFIYRENSMAIREFAPRNSVYFMGSKYHINRANVPTDEDQYEYNKVLICDECFYLDFGIYADAFQNCPLCGKELHPKKNVYDCIRFPDMKASSGDYIGCDEETRRRKYYEIIVNYKEQAENVEGFKIKTAQDLVLAKGSFEHNALIYHINKGEIEFDNSGNRTVRGFNYCMKCNRWLPSYRVEDHVTQGSDHPCRYKARRKDVLSNYILFTYGSHDVWRLSFICPEDIKAEGNHAIMEYYVTIKEMLIHAILLTFNMSERELGGIILPSPQTNEYNIILYETDEGGTGILKSLKRKQDKWDRMLRMVLELMHIKSIAPYEELEPCKKACYNCLLGYWNQQSHLFINRERVIDLIKQLYTTHLESRQIDPIEVKLQKLNNLLGEGPDSELEKRVLAKLFEHNLLPDQASLT